MSVELLITPKYTTSKGKKSIDAGKQFGGSLKKKIIYLMIPDIMSIPHAKMFNPTILFDFPFEMEKGFKGVNLP
ncbi:hypothetical protein QQ020_00625 [Fulvivirgaceae bacterium BMA12]|uniref:Uncharacterized protein n=1 Tax=Agaribacillus aureus TaxID=3051825 RepID=A0ABT8KYK5_9BACT|nr:hypothetical protein [Fulvivirgaceae bacterium BMA12]